METKQVLMTPQWAESLLRGNTGNRKLSKGWVRVLAGAMERGEWKLTHQGVAVAADGRLLDGQHRLQAVIDSQTTVPMMLSTGVNSDAFLVLDQGKKRGLSDIFGEPTQITSAIRTLATLHNENAVTTAKCERLLNSRYGDVLRDLFQHCSQRAKVVGASGASAAAAVRVVAGENRDYVFRVFYDMNNANYADLPPIALSWLKQISQQGGPRDWAAVFVKSLKVLSYADRNTKVLRIGAPEELMTWAREQMDKELNEGPERFRYARPFNWSRANSGQDARA